MYETKHQHFYVLTVLNLQQCTKIRPWSSSYLRFPFQRAPGMFLVKRPVWQENSWMLKETSNLLFSLSILEGYQ